METVFLQILNMSLKACWILAAAIAVRGPLKRLPKRVQCVLWSLAGIRMICPLSIASRFSPVVNEDIGAIRFVPDPQPRQDVSIVNISDSTVVSMHKVVSFETGLSRTHLFAVVWMIGIILLLLFAGYRWLNLKKRLSASVPCERSQSEEHVRICDDLESAFVFGLIGPIVYLPSGLNDISHGYVLAHETAHIKRRDHLLKPLAFILLVIHWFNPLVWMAYALFCRDLEMGCDEYVIKDLSKEERTEYVEVLFENSTGKRRTLLTPLAFGESDIKERVANIIEYRKPKLTRILMSVLLIAVLVFFLMTDSASATGSSFVSESGMRIRKVLFDNGVKYDVDLKYNVTVEDGEIVDVNVISLDISDLSKGDSWNGFNVQTEYGGTDCSVTAYYNIIKTIRIPFGSSPFIIKSEQYNESITLVTRLE